MSYSAKEFDRLYKIYSDTQKTKTPPAQRCKCEFCDGKWPGRGSDKSGIRTVSGVTLTGNGCLASGANPPALTGLSAWLPKPTGTMFGIQRREDDDDAAGRIARIKAYTAPKTGYNCVRCNFKNDYACANHGPDAYLCFNCR